MYKNWYIFRQIETVEHILIVSFSFEILNFKVCSDMFSYCCSTIFFCGPVQQWWAKWEKVEGCLKAKKKKKKFSILSMWRREAVTSVASLLTSECSHSDIEDVLIHSGPQLSHSLTPSLSISHSFVLLLTLAGMRINEKFPHVVSHRWWQIYIPNVLINNIV